jgi:transposase
MDLSKYCVNAVLVEGRSVRSVSAAAGRSKSWVHRHVALYRDGGEEALVPNRRGPKVHPNLTAPDLEDEIVEIRKLLADTGYDAGARSISYHLSVRHGGAPSLSTIHRVLTRRGFALPSRKSVHARAGSASSRRSRTTARSPT